MKKILNFFKNFVLILSVLILSGIVLQGAFDASDDMAPVGAVAMTILILFFYNKEQNKTKL